ncbi:MAG: thioredoxin family protein [Bacillales bacterium]|jgi:thioredoxin-like negative regulator of GroEL|nr:thioredoxin family protein [Bacillales bacterium]
MNKSAIYVYTPMCGTCQVASKMIRVLRELKPNVKIEEFDLNFHKSIAEKYHIESVPCLLIFEDDQLLEKIYAFKSVPYLFDKF